MGVIIHKSFEIKRADGQPKSLHEYVKQLIQSYLNPIKRD
jgi:hypothetical protein